MFHQQTPELGVKRKCILLQSTQLCSLNHMQLCSLKHSYALCVYTNKWLSVYVDSCTLSYDTVELNFSLLFKCFTLIITVCLVTLGTVIQCYIYVDTCSTQHTFT
uniref:Uncharacterized protein n=1 Tax=Cacopsylla melanoneura TaxID=428564 RepID=A0A8D8W9T2_9HEMI